MRKALFAIWGKNKIHALTARAPLSSIKITVQAPQWWLLAFLALYVAFYGPAMHVEELRLQSLFGTEYREYMTDVGRLWPRFAR